MSKVLIKISRKAIYSSKFDTMHRTVHTNRNEVYDNRVALEFLYRFFSEVIIDD